MRCFQRVSCTLLLLMSGCALETFPEVRYVALGDSITGDLTTNTYPVFFVAQRELGVGEFAAVGKGGRTVEEGLDELRHLIELEIYPNTETFIYFLGGADVVDFIVSHDPGLAVSPSEQAYPFGVELEHLLEQIQATMLVSVGLATAEGWTVLLSNYHAIPAGVAPCLTMESALSEVERSRANEYIDLLNVVIEEVAAQNGVTVLDLQQLADDLQADSENFVDCLHPSASGAEIIAEYFAGVVP